MTEPVCYRHHARVQGRPLLDSVPLHATRRTARVSTVEGVATMVRRTAILHRLGRPSLLWLVMLLLWAAGPSRWPLGAPAHAAGFVVTTLNYSGPGSLREAIAAADASPARGRGSLRSAAPTSRCGCYEWR